MPYVRYLKSVITVRGFKDIRPTSDEEFLYARNAVIPMEGFGSVMVTVQPLEGPPPIVLTEVAHVSSFHTSVASPDRLIKTSTGTKDQRLTHKDRTFCTIQCPHGQGVLEYNEPKNDGVFLTRSAQPPYDNEAPSDTWHRRLGHIGPDALEHLPTFVTGVKLTKGPTMINCTECSLSKAHQYSLSTPTSTIDATVRTRAYGSNLDDTGL